jgi:hypothetical protein
MRDLNSPPPSADIGPMRQILVPAIVTVWGLAILLNRLLADSGPTGSDSYQAGGGLALVFALVMVGLGP